MSDGSAVRLTTSKYYTPNGRSIHGQGIIPDLVIEREQLNKQEAEGKKNPDEVFDKLEQEKGAPTSKKADYDNQLQGAIDAIKTMKIYKTFAAKK